MIAAFRAGASPEATGYGPSVGVIRWFLIARLDSCPLTLKSGPRIKFGEDRMRVGVVFPQTEIAVDPVVIRDWAQAV